MDTVICIVESQDHNILPVVLSSPVTTMLNIITDSNIYCFYPRLTSRGVAIKGYLPISRDQERRLAERRIPVYDNTDFLNGPCYETCTKVWRYSSSRKGVGVLHWRGWTARQEDLTFWRQADEFEHVAYKWKIGYECYNRYCHRSIHAYTLPTSYL